MDWIEISVQADGEAAEAVSALFNKLNSRPYGQGGAVTEVSGFDPVGEDHRPTITVRTYLPAGAEDTAERRQRIEEGLWYLGRIWPLGEPRIQVLAEEDWANSWKAHYRPLRVGRHFLIVPAWLWPAAESQSGPAALPGDVTPAPGDHPLVLDPGMAFGTGLHPSTQLCLAAMEDIVRPEQRVLDAGCGSGILSIAAARLGASEVCAFDIDPIAVQATRQNWDLNDPAVPLQVFVSSGPDAGPFWQPPDGPQPQFDVILINILLPVILYLLEQDMAAFLAPGGRMLLAGVIADQEPQLKDALARAGLVVERKLEQTDWVALVVMRP